MAWIVPTIAAVGSLASAGISAASSGSTNQGAENEQYLLELMAQQNAKKQQNIANQQVDRANRLSVAGQTDPYGSTVSYDPTTNTWKSTLGALPQQEADAARNAAISRNTTDLRNAQYTNEQAMRRASENDPLVSAARLAYQNFQPKTVDELGGLLQSQAVDAVNDTTRPVIQDTLRSFARTGTAAAPVLSNMLKTNAGNIRDTIISSRISALQNNANLNNANRESLMKNYAQALSLSTPQLQYSSLSTNDPSATLANQSSAQATRAGTVGAYGAQTSGSLAGPYTTATNNAASKVPSSNAGSTQLAALGKTVGDLTSTNSPLIKGLGSLISGSGTTKTTTNSNTGFADSDRAQLSSWGDEFY